MIDPDYDTTSEENPQDIQVGEQFVHDVATAISNLRDARVLGQNLLH